MYRFASGKKYHTMHHFGFPLYTRWIIPSNNTNQFNVSWNLHDTSWNLYFTELKWILYESYIADQHEKQAPGWEADSWKTSVKTPSIQLKLLFSAVENHTFNKLRHISHLLLFDIPQQFLLILQQNLTIISKVI